MKETIHFSFKLNPAWEQRRSNIAGGGMAEMGRRQERVGLENEFRGSRRVCSSFLCFLLTTVREQSKRDGRQEDGEEESVQ